MSMRNGGFLFLVLMAFTLHLSADVTAAFTTDIGDEPAGRVPLDIQFIDSSTTDDETDPIAEWLWNFGDGETSTDQNPVHTYVDLGYYDVSLQVTSAASLTDSQNENNYVAVFGIDMTYVLDQSSSMLGEKLDNLKDACYAFNNLLDTQNDLGDEAGVISYESRPHVKYPIHIMQNGGTISSMQNTIQQLQSTGVTALFKGVRYGIAQLVNADQSDPDFASETKRAGLLVMSDGRNNASQRSDIQPIYTFVIIHALGFGTDCDPTELIWLRNLTNGTYNFASPNTITTIMSDIYQALKQQGRNADLRGVVLGPHEDISHEFYIDEGSRNLIVNADWHADDLDMTMTLTSPSGKVYYYNPVQNEYNQYKSIQVDTQCAFKIINPETGTWKADISTENYSQTPSEYSFWVLSSNALKLDMDFENSHLQPGEPIRITTQLTNDGPVPAANVQYQIERPDGHIVTMDASDTGVSGVTEYTDTTTPGNYIITAIATGNNANPFKRIVREAVWVDGGEEPLDAEIAPEPVTEYTLSNSPNPFNPETEIAFSLPEASDVSIVIYNMLGQKVRTLVDDKMDAGNHVRVWNGKDDNGRSVGSGIYLYRMKADGFQQTKRMLLLK